MSWQHTDWAMKLDLDAHEKMVLMALAYYANKDTDTCFPSLATLERRAGMCEKSVRNGLAALLRRGLIGVAPHGRGRIYTLRRTVVVVTTVQPATVVTGTATLVPGTADTGTPYQPTSKEHVPDRERESPPASQHGQAMPQEHERREQGRRSAGAVSQSGRREPSRHGNRLASDWQPSADEIAFATREHPALDWRREARAFRDYWTAKAGPEALRGDWSAMWRRWLDQAYRFAAKRPRRADPGGDVGDMGEPWELRVKGFAANGDWLGDLWGAPPNNAGCRAPPALLQRYGFSAVTIESRHAER